MLACQSCGSRPTGWRHCRSHRLRPQLAAQLPSCPAIEAASRCSVLCVQACRLEPTLYSSRPRGGRPSCSCIRGVHPLPSYPNPNVQACGREEDCLATYRTLEKTHPLPAIRRQAADLRYIMEAPKLQARACS